MDGAHYDFSRDLTPKAEPWWTRRLSAMRSLVLMLAVAVATFTAIVALDGTGAPMPVSGNPDVQGAGS